MEMAAAGSGEVGSAVVARSSVGAGFFITNVIFGTGVPVGGASGDSEVFSRAKGGNAQPFLSEHVYEVL